MKMYDPEKNDSFVMQFGFRCPNWQPKTQNNYEMQLQKVTKEHPVEVEQDTYWRGVKIGLETCINVINELRQKDFERFKESRLC